MLSRSGHSRGAGDGSLLNGLASLLSSGNSGYGRDGGDLLSRLSLLLRSSLLSLSGLSGLLLALVGSLSLALSHC